MVRIKDTLRIITLLCVATGYASVAPYVSLPVSALFGALMLLSAVRVATRATRISRWLLNLASLAVIVVSSFRIGESLLIEPILDALLLLVAIKMMEEKQFRDYMQIDMMCMFLLLGSSLISLSLSFLVYLSLLLLLETLSLMLLAHYSSDPEMAISRENLFKVVRYALLIGTIALPTSVLLFLILPRTNFPLLGFLSKDAHARSGFSDTISLGEISGIQEDEQVIFRAEMPQIDDARLYWRGIVLEAFDGTTWRQGPSGPETSGGRVQGEEVPQTLYLEPYGDRYLFALDKATWVSTNRPMHSSAMTYALREEIHERIKYQALSVPTPFLPEESIDRERYLSLPPVFSPRIAGLVQELVAGGTEEDRLNGLLRYLQKGGFAYALENLPTSPQPLEDFLLVHKRGNCEYFASALAVMLRMAGIPARLVGGYRGGYYNGAGGYYLVLQKHAHVWVEAYLGNRGWFRVDPTPMAAPHLASGFLRDLTLRLRLLADTLNYYWTKFVISYDLSRQMQILGKVKASFRKPHLQIESIKPVAARGLAAALLLVLIGSLLLLLARRRGSDARLLAKFLRHMGTYGYTKGRSEGLEEFVSRVAGEGLKERASVFVAEFQKIYYKDRTFTREDISRLEQCIRGIHPG